MKQFIVLLAVFPLMMAFVVQFTVQANNDYRMEEINKIVYNAKEKARTDGYFTSENIQDMKKSISDVADCSVESIDVQVSDDVKYRTDLFDQREMIDCSIAVPLNGIMAFSKFFGISEAENSILYVVEDQFPSERLM